MLRRCTALLALCSGASILMGQTQEFSLLDVNPLIRLAFEQNREILAAQERLAEARGLLRQAGVRPAPTVEAAAASGRPLGTYGEEEFTAGYFQPIETGGKRPKRVMVAEKALALAGAELDEHKRQLAFNIKARYIDAVTSRRKAEAIDHIVSLNRESYELVNARVQRGDAAPLERQLLLVELRRAEAQRAAITGLAQSAESELRRTIAIDLDGASIPPANALPTPLVTETLDEVRWRALQARPDLRAARTLASQSAAELELVESLARPDITLSAQYTRRYAQFEDPLRTTGSGSPLLLQDRDNLLTLGVSIPLQTRKRNQGNAEAAAARQNAARLRSQHLEATIPIEIDAAWQHYQASQKALEILNRGVVDESEKNLSVIRQAYDLGQLRLLDVLNEQRRLLETQLSYIDAEADMAMSLAELERAAGGELK